MKICVIPGVGFHKDEGDNNFIPLLKNEIPQAKIEFFNWKHDYAPPDLPYKQDKISSIIRSLVTEVIFDAEYVLLHARQMEIPKADVYIGHSAGSIISLMHAEDAYVISMASPASLLESLQSMAFMGRMGLRPIDGNRKILNIVNTKDILASPIKHQYVTNWIYTSNFRIGLPFATAHWDYWRNKDVICHIAKSIKKYCKEKEIS